MDGPIYKSHRARLIEVATGHFLRSGMIMTKMDDISQEAGVSKKTLYKEFHSKERLVNCCLELILKQLFKDLCIVLNTLDSAEDSWQYSLMLISRRASEASPMFHRDLLSKKEHLDFFHKQWDLLTNKLLQRFELTNIGKLKIVLDAFQNMLIHVLAHNVRGVNPEQLSNILLPIYASNNVFRVE